MGAAHSFNVADIPIEGDYRLLFHQYLQHYSESDLDNGLAAQFAEPVGGAFGALLGWPTCRPNFKYYAEGSTTDRETHQHTTGASGVFRVHDQPAFPISEMFFPGRVYSVRVIHATLGGNEAAADIRSMSIKFSTPGAVSPLDLLMTTGSAAPFCTASAYAAFSWAYDTTSSTVNTDELQHYLRRNPLAFNALCAANKLPPSSYSALHYYDHNTYKMISADKKVHFIRLRVIPKDRRMEEAPRNYAPWTKFVDETKAGDYLYWEYVDMLRRGPIEYVLQMQIREDPRHDPHERVQHALIAMSSLPWSADIAPWVDVGLFTLDSQLEDCASLYFSPTNTPGALFVPDYHTADDFTTAYHVRCSLAPTTAGIGGRDIPIHEGEAGGLVKYRVRLFVGARKGRGEQATVTVRIFGEQGKSNPCRLSFWCMNNFANLQCDEFFVYTTQELDPLCLLTFTVSSQGVFTRWYVKRVEVKNVRTGRGANFVIGKWLEEGETSFLESSCILLHCEADITAKQYRRAFMQQQRAQYQWTDQSSRALPTYLAIPESGFLLAERPKTNNDYDWASLVRHAMKLLAVSGDGHSMGKATSLQSYSSFTEPSDLPVNPWESDSTFADMYLTGPFAHMLTRLDNPPNTWGTALLASKVDKSKLYVVDLYVLEGLPCQTGKVVHPGMVVFASHTGSPGLLPVLIQLTMVGRAQIFTAANSPPLDWILAKMHIACAAAHVHIVSTLVQCYFGVEPFVISMRRNLPDCHPLTRVLLPHMEGVIYACHAARKKLLGPNGQFMSVFSLTHGGMDTLVERIYAKWCLTRDNCLPDSIASKAIEVANFPYRNDGLTLWKALENYVRSMLDLWYVSNEDVISDTELMAFIDDLTVTGLKGRGGNVLGPRRPFANLDDLVILTTSLIWSVTVQAATMTIPLWRFASLVPLVPMSIHRTSSFEKVTQGMILESLPPLDVAATQLAFLRVWTMATISTTTETKDISGQPMPDRGTVLPLGYFEEDVYMHATPDDIVKGLQQTLAQAEITSPIYKPSTLPNRLMR